MQAEAVICFWSTVYGKGGGRVTHMITLCYVRLCPSGLSRLERDSPSGLEEASCHVVRGTTRKPQGQKLWRP